ncbi:universal stress protein [Nonomuraea sp. NPDC051941]|uniref:universal stress protein n=1 Tax=Nonomuraea sp. NPDC051941 TaxID=3364373 RepID=UPI0037C68E27
MAGHIVVGVDGSAPATAAVEWAAADAQRRGLAVRIVHVCEQWPHSESTEYCAGALEAAAGRARELTRSMQVTTEMLKGNVIADLIAESRSADSLAVGSRGLGGFAGMVLGSVSLGVAGHAAGPVVVVRAPSALQHDRVVVGYDGSGHSEAAMAYAIEQARARGAQLHVVSAWQVPAFASYGVTYSSLLEDIVREETHTARERVTPWRERNPDLVISDEQPCEHPVKALVDAARTADLVVVGSRGLSGFASAVLGSVSHGVLHHVSCPVAVVRPRAKEEP